MVGLVACLLCISGDFFLLVIEVLVGDLAGRSGAGLMALLVAHCLRVSDTV